MTADRPDARKKSSRGVRLHEPKLTVGQREAPQSPASIPLSHEEIATRAYEYYVARGTANGSADDDWHRAVADLKRRSWRAISSGVRRRGLAQSER
jgi:Protein of unknown function (DUF2934)